jgi:hypothetical protein
MRLRGFGIAIRIVPQNRVQSAREAKPFRFVHGNLQDIAERILTQSSIVAVFSRPARRAQ